LFRGLWLIRISHRKYNTTLLSPWIGWFNAI
jgi:hypothetical protein